MKTVAIIGASNDRHKYGNKALRAFAAQGHRVVPIHHGGGVIEGYEAYQSVLDVPFPIDMASFYVPPAVGLRVVEEVARKRIGELWLNPGSDGPEVIERAKALGLDPIVACSIIGIGDSPSRY
jgi:predicted CoA-binding protein